MSKLNVVNDADDEHYTGNNNHKNAVTVTSTIQVISELKVNNNEKRSLKPECS